MKTLPQSFVGGELSPRMMGRPDDPKYQHGAALLRNFFVHPTGAASLRPGTAFVNNTRTHDTRSRLIRYRAAGGQDIQVELGFRAGFPGSTTVPGYARFHRKGSTVLHSTAWNAATAYVVRDFVTSGGVLYRCIQAHTNQTPPNATFWRSHAWFTHMDFAPAAVSVANNEIDLGAPHNKVTGEPIEFTNTGGALPAISTGSLGPGVVLYAIVVSANVLKVATTLANALVGTAIDITGQGTGTHRLHRRYTAGELVSYLSNVWYCRTTQPIVSGSSVDPATAPETLWYQMPATGEYEIPTTLGITQDALFAMTAAQEGRVLSTAARGAFPCELTAVAADEAFVSTNPLIPYDHWRWTQVSFVPSITPPPLVNVQATKRGDTLQIVSIQAVGGGGTRTAFTVTVDDHRIPPGGHVYIEGTAHAPANNAWWRAEPGGANNQFVILNPDTGAYLAPPAPGASGGTARVADLHSDVSHSYVVTSVDADDRESVASPPATATNNLFITGAFNEVNWGGLTPGAERYRVYRLITGAGIYGLLGESTTTTFKDEGKVSPNLGKSPPILDLTLTSAPNHTSLPVGGEILPEAVTHFEGRRAYALGQDVWLTRSNTSSDLSYSRPVKATDRIRQRVKTKIACEIRHLVPLGRLLALADTTEIRIGPANTEALTPDSFAARSDSYVGAAPAQPETMANSVLFAGNRGGQLYQAGFSEEAGGFVVQSLCDRAAHLFSRRRIVQIAAMVEPVPIAFSVSDDGRLFGLTFVPGQQVFAWHQHTTDGAFESVSFGNEDGEDRVYAIVRRTIQGLTRRYVERFASFGKVAWNDSWFVDSGVRLVTSSAVTTVSNLGHLEAKEVAVFANGLEQASQVVAGGQITLATPLPAGNNSVLVGLPPLGELQTVRAAFAIEAYGSGKPKNTSKVWVLVDESGVFEAGPQLNAMYAPDNMTAGAPTSDMVEVRVDNEWAFAGQLFIRQTKPLPLNIVSITAELELAG